MSILTQSGTLVVEVKPIGFGGVDAILDGSVMAGLQQRGSIRRGDGLGFVRFGHSAFGAFGLAGGVYQRRHRIKKDSLGRPTGQKEVFFVKERYYRPTNPNTPAQQANRSKFALANAGWASLTAAEKKQWNSRATRQSRSGQRLYISWFMRNN